MKPFYLTFSKDTFEFLEVNHIYTVGFNYKSGQTNDILIIRKYKDTKLKRFLNKYGFKFKINTIKVITV